MIFPSCFNSWSRRSTSIILIRSTDLTSCRLTSLNEALSNAASFSVVVGILLPVLAIHCVGEYPLSLHFAYRVGTVLHKAATWVQRGVSQQPVVHREVSLLL